MEEKENNYNIIWLNYTLSYSKYDIIMHFEEDMGCLVQNIATSLLDLMLAKFMFWRCLITGVLNQ